MKILRAHERFCPGGRYIFLRLAGIYICAHLSRHTADMDQQSHSTTGTATVTVTTWVIAGTAYCLASWTWSGPTAPQQSAPEPPVRDGQYQQTGDDELRTVAPLPASRPEDDQATGSAESGDDEPAHEDLSDPVVAAFVGFLPADVPVHDGRKGDVEVRDAYVPLSLYDTHEHIYRALVQLCRQHNAVRIADGVWRVEIGYKALASEAGCSRRSICAAIAELAAHGYVLRRPEMCGGRHCSQYYVRDEAAMTIILQAEGVRYARKLGAGHIALYRTADEVQDDTLTRN